MQKFSQKGKLILECGFDDCLDKFSSINSSPTREFSTLSRHSGQTTGIKSIIDKQSPWRLFACYDQSSHTDYIFNYKHL